jgi:hypothetical protein
MGFGILCAPDVHAAGWLACECMQPARTLNGSLTFMLLIENLGVLLAVPAGKWKSVVKKSSYKEKCACDCMQIAPLPALQLYIYLLNGKPWCILLLLEKAGDVRLTFNS